MLSRARPGSDSGRRRRKGPSWGPRGPVLLALGSRTAHLVRTPAAWPGLELGSRRLGAAWTKLPAPASAQRRPAQAASPDERAPDSAGRNVFFGLCSRDRRWHGVWKLSCVCALWPGRPRCCPRARGEGGEQGGGVESSSQAPWAPAPGPDPHGLTEMFPQTRRPLQSGSETRTLGGNAPKAVLALSREAKSGGRGRELPCLVGPGLHGPHTWELSS